MAFPNNSQSSVLTINLDAIATNYRLLETKANNAKVGSVLKANAYGLGVEQVAQQLQRVGCNVFFVATLDEGIRLRLITPNAEIHVFNGILPGWPAEMHKYNLCPVLNSLEQIKIWQNYTRGLETCLLADLHIDTGMCRLGLSPKDLKLLTQSPDLLKFINLDVVVSHLANANDPDDFMNQEQLADFRKAAKVLKSQRLSIAASSGIFLGSNYHFDLVRPGIALYGGNPLMNKPNPMEQVVRLQGRILQVRYVNSPQTIGYGSTYKVPGPMRIATVAIGYADGYLRSLTNTGTVWIESYEAQVVGRISMDLTTVDVTQIPEHLVQVGALVDFFGPRQSIDKVALSAGTIDYELLTRLGTRFQRDYIGGE